MLLGVGENGERLDMAPSKTILAQAQKMIDIQAIDIWTAGVLQDAAVDNNVLDLINFDEKNRHKAEMLGIPPKIINSITKVADIRREKAKALEAAEVAKMIEVGFGLSH